MDVNTDPSYGRTIDSDMALGSGMGLDITLALGGKQASHISLFLATFTSPILPLSTTHESFCFSFSTFSTIYLPIIMAPAHLPRL